MVPTPLQLVAAINLDLYCALPVRDHVEQVTASDGLMAAAAAATPRESNLVGTECASLLDPFDLEGLEYPLVRRCLARDALADGLPSIHSSLINSLSVVCQDRTTIEIIQETHCAGSGVGTSPVLVGECAGRPRIYAKVLCQPSEKAPTTESGSDSLPSPAAECSPLHSLTFLVQSRYEPCEDVALGVLPGEALRAHRRAYFSVLVLELVFQGTPSKGTGGGGGGRVELTVVSLSLNEDELRLLRRLTAQEPVAGPFRTPRPDSDPELLFRNQAILHAHRLGFRLCQHLSTTVGWNHREKMD